MVFKHGLKKGDILNNKDIIDIFKCGNMGGMRRSHKTNTLVLIADHIKGIYEDRWVGDELHYTGMEKKEIKFFILLKIELYLNLQEQI